MDQSPQPVQLIPKWFLTVVTVPILLGLLWFGRGFLMPIALATLLLILNLALIDRLNSATIAGRSVPGWLAYVVATAFIFAAVIGLGYLVSNQADALNEAAPRYAERFAALRIETENFIGSDRVSAIERAIEGADVSAWLTELAATAGGIIGNISLILLYLAFMLGERGAFTEKLPRICLTPEEASRLSNSLRSISLGIRQYMWINTVTSAMSGMLAFVVMKFLDIDFAASLALMVFLVNFIPSIGSVLGVLFPTLVALLQFDTVVPALIVIVVYGGGDAIIGNILQSKLQGKSLNLSTFMVMVALTFWGMMWGGVGAFMAVPLTVVIMIVCSQFSGLQPYARILSSDGKLPGDEEIEVEPEGEEGVVLPGKPGD